MIKKFLINENNSIKQAINSLDEISRNYNCLLVKNKKNQIIGSITDGDIRRSLVKKSNFNPKLYRSNIYLHNIFYIDIFLKFGLKQILLNSQIKIDSGPVQKVKNKFNDRAGRKTDYGVLEKIDTVDFFYEKNRLNFFQFLFAISTIYSWSIDINILLQNEGYLQLSKQYFSETLKYDNKKIIFLSFSIIILKNLFSGKSFFIIKLFYSLLMNKKII